MHRRKFLQAAGATILIASPAMKVAAMFRDFGIPKSVIGNFAGGVLIPSKGVALNNFHPSDKITFGLLDAFGQPITPEDLP